MDEFIYDEQGKWTIRNGEKYELLEPSEDWLEKQKPTVEQIKREILQELADLDVIVPRVVEDIIVQGEFAIHQSKLDIIERKNQLRKLLTEV